MATEHERFYPFSFETSRPPSPPLAETLPLEDLVALITPTDVRRSP